MPSWRRLPFAIGTDLENVSPCKRQRVDELLEELEELLQEEDNRRSETEDDDD